HVALTALLKLLEQVVESAVEHRSGGGAAEDSPQRAAQKVAKAATEVAALSARQASADVTARGAGWLGRRRVGPAQILHRVDRIERAAPWPSATCLGSPAQLVCADHWRHRQPERC